MTEPDKIAISRKCAEWIASRLVLLGYSTFEPYAELEAALKAQESAAPYPTWPGQGGDG